MPARTDDRIDEQDIPTPTSSLASADAGLYESYGRLINPAYPMFLRKLGLNSVASRAEGATIVDSEGRTYIDCVGGYGLFNLGHNHDGIIQALADQLNKRQLLTRPFITDIQVEFATCLQEIAPGDLTCSFVCNSGSEAIDSALKLARLQGRGKQIITAENSFHGYTFGALSASGISSFKRSFQPLVPGIVHVPFGNVEAVDESVSSETAAVLLEPIQHEAGIVLPPDGYLQEVRRICDERSVIFILDEIKTGIGKTGRMFACEHYGVVPDILILGKSLGGGLMPIGAVVARSNLWKRFGLSFPMSASSFAGNALACRAGLATIRHFQETALLEECAEKGKILLRKISEHVQAFPGILRGVCGLGLLIGLEARGSGVALALAREMIRQGVLVVPAFANPAVLMVEPPLVIDSEQINAVLDCLRTACVRVSCST